MPHWRGTGRTVHGADRKGAERAQGRGRGMPCFYGETNPCVPVFMLICGGEWGTVGTLPESFSFCSTMKTKIPFNDWFRRRRFRRETGLGSGEGVFPGGSEGRKRRRWGWLFGVLLAVWAAHSATSGLLWSTYFHPDELAIVRWIDRVQRNGYISHRVYPSGWFELYRLCFVCEKNASKWLNSVLAHVTQDGRVAAAYAESFEPKEPVRVTRKLGHEIQDGRNFNAWLYVLTAVFLYAACLEAGFHPVAAFLSGVFFLGAAGPLEFAHYCETDAALLVSMACFAWLAARALRKRSWAWSLAASCAAGFAVSCKFTLLPLLLWCVVSPFAVLCGRGRPVSRWLPAALLLVLASAGLALGGYLLGTPALRADPGRYMALLHRTSRRTYAEIRRNLGGSYTWSGASVLRLESLGRHLGGIGVLPLAWGVFSWGFWFAPKFRRQLAGIPWLLPVFLPFLVCCCPFVRRQELLPLSVIFSMGAALPLQWWLSRPAGFSRHWAGRTAAAGVAALGVAAFAAQFARGEGMASCFRMRDTRAEAQNWLRTSLPADAGICFDAYVGQITRGLPVRRSGFAGLPFRWEGAPPPAGDGRLPGYYVENEGFPGRLPVRDPQTGRFFPQVRRNMAAYNASVFPVRTWGVSRTTPVPVFAQPRVRLVSFDVPGPDAFDVPVGYSRPVLVLPDLAHLYDADGPAGIACLRAARTFGKRSSVHLNLEDGPRWLVTRMLEGGESVRVDREGLFRPGKSDLGAGGAVAAALAATPWERVRARFAAHSTMRCRMRGDDHEAFCATYLTPSAAEAARDLRGAGNPSGALALLRGAGTLDAAGRVEAFWAARAAGEEPEEEWTEAARGAVAAADRLAAERDAAGRRGATLCGVPVGVAEDFARVKLPPCRLEAGARLPLWLPQGRYALTVAAPAEAAGRIPPRLFADQAGDFAAEGDSGGECRLTAALDVGAGGFLRVPDGGSFDAFDGELEIRWSPVDRTLDAAESLRAALDG